MLATRITAEHVPAPVIPPPELHAEPARLFPTLQAISAPPRVAHMQASATSTTPQTVRPVASHPPAQQAGEESHTWQDRLSAWLQAHRVYPDAARRAGEEGSPTIRFTIARDGSVTAVALIRTSGSELLDTAALALLDHAQVPPLPSNFPDSVSVTISLRYSLHQ